MLNKTNSSLRSKIEPQRYLTSVASEIPVIQEEVVETSDPIAENYYETEEVVLYEDLNQLREMGSNTMLPNYQIVEESDYPPRSRLLEGPDGGSHSRTVYYVLSVG